MALREGDHRAPYHRDALEEDDDVCVVARRSDHGDAFAPPKIMTSDDANETAVW